MQCNFCRNLGRRARNRAWLILVAAVLANPVAARAAVRVHLTNGSTLTVDSISVARSGRSLELHVERPGIHMMRRLPWSRIESVEENGTRLSHDVLHQAAGFATTVSGEPVPGAAASDGPPGGVRRAAANVHAAMRPDSATTAGMAAVQPGSVFAGGPYTASHSQDVPQFVGPLVRNQDFQPGVALPPIPLHHGVAGRWAILGVRAEPLSAYRELERQYFPNGIPISERGFALGMFRSTTGRAMYGWPAGMPGPIPGAVWPMFPPMMGPMNSLAPGFGGVPPVENRPIRSIRAAALPISANGQADWDALQLDVAAVDYGGRIVPIPAGSVQATLWGQRQSLVHGFGNQFLSQTGAIERVESWSRMLAGDSNLGDGPGRFVLSLPHPLPDQDARWAAYGDLHVEVSVPGVGNFSTICPAVPLKQASELAARELLQNGSRFFASDVTTGNRQNSGPRYDAMSNSGPDGRVFTVQP